MNNRYLMPDDPEYPAKRRLWVKDPVDGGQVLREDSRNTLSDWCDKNCQGKYWVGMGFIDFELVTDYSFALLSLESATIK